MSRSGLTLATTLASLALALILGLVLTSTSLGHLHQSSRKMNVELATTAADAVLAEASERVVSDPEFGIDRADTEVISLELGDSTGYLSFHEASAASNNVPYSTSNRFGLDPETGWDNTTVPPRSVQFYAVGESGGARVVVESLLQVPEFPYVVASSGPIDSSGALAVGTAASLDEVTSPGSLKPAALASNDKVDVQGSAKISGTIEAASSITLGPNVELKGEVKPFAQPLHLDDIDITALRPNASVPLGNSISPELAGRYHHNGPSLRITGGLTLDDAVLYVNGDTHISGGIQGKGAVISNGNLTVQGSSRLIAETKVALVCQGDLRVTGDKPDSSFFQGLVYTEGDFYAEDVTLIGAFAANHRGSSTEPGSRVQLKDVNLVSYPEYSKFDLDAVPFLIWGSGGKYSQGGTEQLYLLECDHQDLQILIDAVTQQEQQGGSGNDGATPDDGSTTMTAIDYPAVLAVTRGRVATVQDGRLISEWRTLDSDEVLAQIQGVQLSNTASLTLLQFEADPNSLFWEVVAASLHLDLNEFLGAHAGVRVTSWQKL